MADATPTEMLQRTIYGARRLVDTYGFTLNMLRDNKWTETKLGSDGLKFTKESAEGETPVTTEIVSGGNALMVRKTWKSPEGVRVVTIVDNEKTADGITVNLCVEGKIPEDESLLYFDKDGRLNGGKSTSMGKSLAFSGQKEIAAKHLVETWQIPMEIINGTPIKSEEVVKDAISHPEKPFVVPTTAIVV